MDDNVSVKSFDSMMTSGEYEIITKSHLENFEVPKSPTLNIADNGCLQNLEENLIEAIQEINMNPENIDPAPDYPGMLKPNENAKISSDTLENMLKSEFQTKTPKKSNNEVNKVGQSVFYDCMDISPEGIVKQDCNKIDKYDNEDRSDIEEDFSEIDKGCTIFSGITYLGATNINAPKSDAEFQRKIADLNSNSTSTGLKVSVSIPSSSEGLVILYDSDNESVVATYEIHRILYYAPGQVDTKEEACFGFTWSHGDSSESTVFQCHAFKCHIPEAISRVSHCFLKAFQQHSHSLTGSITSGVDNSIMMASITSDISGNPLTSADYEFIVSLEIRERVAKNSFSAVPRDRSIFKLRCNTDKEIFITVKQVASTLLQPLFIERCFGVLVSSGKIIRQSDVQLLTVVSMGYQKIETVPQGIAPYQILAEWNAHDKAFKQLNYESPKMILTVAVDLVIKGIQEPVRFIIETPVTIQSQNEIRIMDHFISKRAMLLKFYLQLKQADEGNWKVNSIDPSEEIFEQSLQTSSSILKLGINNLTKMVRSTSTVSIEDDTPTDYSSDGDEPLLSGTGEVSKDCSQDTLNEWDPVLKEFEWDTEKRPKNLPALVRLGIPEALRGKVWQKLANVENKIDMTDKYRTLITKETECENVIQRDIHRTFPAHKKFKDIGGSGQDALFKVSKAYAVYDKEMGYCQGLSFIAASLLLHMPEEEAFCVLVALMYDYGLRNLYKQGFEILYLRLFQLDCLIKDQLPKLYEHFFRTGIETHMFASQWFLTLYTARFPLYFVFHVLDLFLLDGMPILFQVAIALLSICEAELIKLDFEGILKYFRITLPKKFRSYNQARKIMKLACEKKVKKLKHYEEQFLIKRQAEDREENAARIYEERFSEERKKLRNEITQLQKRLQESFEKANLNDEKNTKIIQEYKHIIRRQERQIIRLREILDEAGKFIFTCQNCLATKEPMKSFLLYQNDVLEEISEMGNKIEHDMADITETEEQNNLSIQNFFQEKNLFSECTKQSVRKQSNDQIVTTVEKEITQENKLSHDQNDSIDININQTEKLILTEKNNSNEKLKITEISNLGPLDPLNTAMQRIRELELELARTKLAQVEAECKSQDLSHQLNTTIAEVQNNRNSWQPWLSRTLNSIQEKVSTRKDSPTFQSYTANFEIGTQENIENLAGQRNPQKTNHSSVKKTVSK